MLHTVRDYCTAHPQTAWLVAAVLANLLYFVGVTFPLIIILLGLLMVAVRLPALLDSFFGRLVAGVLILLSLGQIVSVLQFLLNVNGFRIFASLLTISVLALAYLSTRYVRLGKMAYLPTKLNQVDYAAGTALVLTVLPFILFVVFVDSKNLAAMGGVQGIDGVNHFALIAETASQQSLDYSVGDYYPKAFHLVFGFIQSSFGIEQNLLSWALTAKLFFLQYAVLFILLVYSLLALFVASSPKIMNDKKAYLLAGGVSIAAILAVYYLPLFIHHGFLSYAYISAAILFGAAILVGWQQQNTQRLSIYERYYPLILFLIISAGVSVAWPLWSPALGLIALLYFLLMPAKAIGWDKTTLKTLGIALLLAVPHVVPIGLQLVYSGGDSSQGINLTGGISIFHYGLLAFGCMAIAVYTIWRPNTVQQRNATATIFIGMLALILPLMVMQYILLGEVRYYTIKLAIIFELFTLVIAVGVLADLYRRADFNKALSLLVIPVIYLMVFVPILALTGNPFKELYEVARGFMVARLPEDYIDDLNSIKDLGDDDKIKSSNMVTMHVNSEDRLHTNMQLFYWAVMMEYSGSRLDERSLACSGGVYGNMFRQDFGPKAQNELIAQIRKCAELARSNGQTYYIITDDKSQSRIEQLFGVDAKVL